MTGSQTNWFKRTGGGVGRRGERWVFKGCYGEGLVGGQAVSEGWVGGKAGWVGAKIGWMGRFAGYVNQNDIASCCNVAATMPSVAFTLQRIEYWIYA